jgi:rubrerythrin
MPTITGTLRTSVLYLATAAIPFLFFSSCGKKEPQKVRPVVTIANLQTAYAREMKFNFMYTRLMQRAEKDHAKKFQLFYKALARSEQIHARNHQKLLQSLGIEPTVPSYDSIATGTPQQSLRMAYSSEQIEAGSMYPNMIRSAEAENSIEAVTQFKMTLEADKHHEELLGKALEAGGKVLETDFSVCPLCGYLITSKKMTECPTCHTPASQMERIQL